MYYYTQLPLITLAWTTSNSWLIYRTVCNANEKKEKKNLSKLKYIFQHRIDYIYSLAKIINILKQNPSILSGRHDWQSICSFNCTFRTLHATWVWAKIAGKKAWNKQTRLQTIKTHENMCRRVSVLFQRESHWKVWLSHFPLCSSPCNKIEWIFLFSALVFHFYRRHFYPHQSMVKDVENIIVCLLERSHLWQK